MKYLTFFTVLFLTNFGFSQVFYNSSSKNLRYAGALTEEVSSMLSETEKQLLNDCILQCGIKPDSAIWITKEVYDQLDDPDYYSTKVVYKSSSNIVGGENFYEGKNTLEKPQFMVFLDRYNEEFEVIVQMYY